MVRQSQYRCRLVACALCGTLSLVLSLCIVLVTATSAMAQDDAGWVWQNLLT